MRALFFSAVLVLSFVSLTAHAAAVQGGAIPVQLPLFPSNNWWNLDVSNAPLDPDSASYIAFIQADDDPEDLPGCHPDFGGDAGNGNVYGFPFIVVDGSQPKKLVDFVWFDDESDGVGVPFYPIPDEAITQNGWIEGGHAGNVDERDDGDRHILIVDKTNNHLYELYSVWFNGTNWEAGSGAFFDMNTNNHRPEGWTSADAAGLAILPGLVRYDEVFGPDEIRHALRVTVRDTNGHVYPASHTAGSASGALPMGARLRLKASKNISTYSPEIQKIFRAFKKYGLIVADNGSDMYISGVYDTRWDNDILNPAFHSLHASDFEVVQLGWKPTNTFALTVPYATGANDAATATLTVRDINDNVATGYTGTVHFTSTDGAATLPVDYTFTPGDAGVHTFTNGVILRTPGLQTVVVNDTVTTTLNTARGVAVGPATPASFTSTASGATSIQSTWASSSGATQYELARACTSNSFSTITTTASTSYNDTTVPAGSVCVYKVRALDASALSSSYSTPDVATTFSYTDPTLVTNTTLVKATHFDQLRQTINAFRTIASLSAMSFTAPVPAAGVTIRSAHVQNLRTALDQARAALGMTALSYTDPSPTTVKAVHVQQLRSGLQ